MMSRRFVVFDHVVLSFAPGNHWICYRTLTLLMGMAEMPPIQLSPGSSQMRFGALRTTPAYILINFQCTMGTSSTPWTGMVSLSKMVGFEGHFPGHQRRQWLAHIQPPFFRAELNEWQDDGRGFIESFYRRLRPRGADPAFRMKKSRPFDSSSFWLRRDCCYADLSTACGGEGGAVTRGRNSPPALWSRGCPPALGWSP